MLDELIKSLGPIAGSIIIGILGLAAGGMAIYRGIVSNKDVRSIEDKRLEWKAREQLENLEQNSFKMLENQNKMIDAIQRMTEAINRYNDIMWNTRTFDKR